MYFDRIILYTNLKFRSVRLVLHVYAFESSLKIIPFLKKLKNEEKTLSEP